MHFYYDTCAWAAENYICISCCSKTSRFDLNIALIASQHYHFIKSSTTSTNTNSNEAIQHCHHPWWELYPSVVIKRVSHEMGDESRKQQEYGKRATTVVVTIIAFVYFPSEYVSHKSFLLTHFLCHSTKKCDLNFFFRPIFLLLFAIVTMFLCLKRK